MGRENGKSIKVELKKAMNKMHPFIRMRKSLFDEMKMLTIKKGWWEMDDMQKPLL